MSFKQAQWNWRNMLSLSLSMVLVFFMMVPHARAENAGGNSFEVYVSNDGSDSNPGTEQKPFRTLEAARDAVRSLKSSAGLPEAGATIYLREGEYMLEQSFRLGSEDSGQSGKPIRYAAYPGEKVQIIGGTVLPGNAFKGVSDQAIRDRLQESIRDQVMEVDLQALGMTEYGAIQQGGMGPFQNIVNPELFFNGQSMRLSRYPNEGYVKTGNIVIKGGNPRGTGPAPIEEQMIEEFKKGHTFTYTDPRPGQWLNTGDIWMFGYFYWDWADGNLNISKIDKEKQEISTKTASYYSIRSGQRYYYYNILEEIDQPGEWYLDRSAGKLYFYPPSDVSRADIKLSTMEDPLILLEDASYISLENLELGFTRGTAVMIKGGSHNKVAGSVIQQTGGYGVTIKGGENNGVLSSDIFETGIGGVHLEGGDRITLTPGNNYVKNSNIYAFSRIKATYSPAVSLHGTGNIVSNNYIHDAPHMAIAISGNNHKIEYNEIYNVLTETGDAGAIYMGRDWSQQGNIIRYNYLHKLQNNVAHDQVGIYLDDMASGTKIYGNLLIDVYRPILIGGGRDNEMNRNVVIRGKRAGVYIDNRAMGWAAATAAPGGLMYKSLQAMPYQTPPWSEQYPHLVNYLEDEPAVPKRNTVMDNIVYDNPVGLDIVSIASQTGTVKNNLTRGVTNPQEKSQFDSIVNQLPVDRYGLYNDNYRHNAGGNREITSLAAMKNDIENGSWNSPGELVPGFTEGFEEGLSSWIVSGGAKTTTEAVYSGTHSLLIEGDRENVQRNLPTTLNRKVSVWYKHDPANQALANVATVDNTQMYVHVGVNTNVSKTNYVFRVGANWMTTTIPRDNKWHKFTFDYSSGTDLKLLIDDTVIHTTTEITNFNRIILGDLWIDNKKGKVYFDEVVMSADDNANNKVKASVTGDDSAFIGEELELVIGLQNIASGFNALDLVVKYDPKVLSFNTKPVAVDEHTSYSALADEAIETVPDNSGLMIIGTALQPNGTIRILAAATGAGITKDGNLFKLRAQIKEAAETASTEITVADILISKNGSEIMAESASHAILLKSKVDKDALTALIAVVRSEISIATEGSEDGEYPYGSKAKLQLAMNKAQAVLSHMSATQADVDQAVIELQRALNFFKGSVISISLDKSVISKVIELAQAKHNASEEGVKLGQYPAGQRAALQAAIDQAIHARAGATSQKQLDDAANVLNTALAAFASKIVTLTGDSKMTIKDLSLVAKYYGKTKEEANWQLYDRADVYGDGITIQVLAKVARMILDDWVLIK